MMPLEWQNRAACLDEDPELFFPTPGERRQAEEAKAVCRRCPVRFECGLHAHEERMPYGVWGGSTEEERAHSLRVAYDPSERRPHPPTYHERCGTYSGVGRHRRMRETLCEDCRNARTAYERMRKRRQRKVAS